MGVPQESKCLARSCGELKGSAAAQVKMLALSWGVIFKGAPQRGRSGKD